MTDRFKLVGIYTRKVEMVRRKPVQRAYVILEYDRKLLGVLAIPMSVFRAMAIDGVPVRNRLGNHLVKQRGA
jgi:hypothetical protein